MPFTDTLRRVSAALIFLLAPIFKAVGGDAGDGQDVNHPSFSVAAESAVIDVEDCTLMSVDVAPDGEHVIFDLLGDLYDIPIGREDRNPIFANGRTGVRHGIHRSRNAASADAVPGFFHARRQGASSA